MKLDTLELTRAETAGKNVAGEATGLVIAAIVVFQTALPVSVVTQTVADTAQVKC